MAGNNEKVNTDLCDNAAGVLESYNSNMNTAVESLQNNMNQFGWGWKGRASENALGAWSEVKNAMSPNRSSSMAGYSAMLRQTVAPGYLSTETQNQTELAERYLGE